MLYTNLKHIESAVDYTRIIRDNERVVIICGSMGPVCVPVYRMADELEAEYIHVKFFDMEYDNPESDVIRSLPEVQEFRNVPYIIWYKNGKVVQLTSGIQSKVQVIDILEKEFGVPVNS